jgi:hypothetical protein
MSFQYDAERTQLLLDRCSDHTASNAERGKSLETLVAELFLEIPGLRYDQRNRLAMFGAQEIDIAVWNDQDRKGLYGFAQMFLIECKNWSSPVGSLEVAWFDTKLRMRGLDFGVLVAMNDITGNEHARTSAQAIISSALAEKRSIVVITRDDLETLSDTDSLVELLKIKRLKAAVA